MRPWLRTSALIGAALLCANLASAQSTRPHDDRDDDEDGIPNYALSVAVGLVEPDSQTENYYTASFRIRIGRGDEDDEGGGGDPRRDRSIQGYLEPEIGYWKSTADNLGGSDTLVGVNLVGAFPFAAAESFLGVGVGAHFIDSELLESNPNLSGSETKLGANAQFGLDLHITHALSVFGTGRFDLVQGAKDNVQSKIYLGLRARF
jgi:hypothetical protein